MPPKAARGRGRPRGGRGAAASGTARPPPVEDTPAPQPTPQPAPEEASSSQLALPQTITPQNELNSPNSSPATIPTETPAPTPVRPPVQRNVASGSGTKPAAAASKFRPKAIRRGQAEREQLAQEAEKKRVEAEKAAEAARLRAAGVLTGRGAKSGRSRGGMMGRGRDTGLFGITPQALQHGHRAMDLENVAAKANYGSGGPGLSDFFKTEGGESSRAGGSGGHGGGGGGGGGGMRDIKYEPQYPDLGDDDAPRFNIEDINRKDDVIITGSRRVDKGKSSTPEEGMRPIRLDRTEHKERVTVVNTGEETKPAVKVEAGATAESSDSDVVMIDEDRSAARSGLLHDAPMPVHIKPEPADENSLSSIAIKDPSSPEAKHSKAKGKGKEPIPIPGIDVEKKRKPATKSGDQKPPEKDATAEDKAEYERHLEDVRVLAGELGGMQAQPQEDVAMEGTDEVHDKRSGRLYLFQFPGVLSKLYNPLTKKPEKPKPKGKEAEKDKEIEITSSTSNPPKKPPIKVEEGEVIIKQEEEAVKKPEEVVEEVGAVGRMVVRKSGRVEITWGNNDMIVQRGTSHGFLGAGYVVDTLDRVPVAPTEGVDRIGLSTSMGPMMGKFVVVPDFEKTW